MIDAKTRLIALIGHPVAHSMSPAMHNAAFQQHGLNFVYLAFDVKNLKLAVDAMRQLGFRGYSVTIP
ncbi:MAG: shikimate dehydrogenase, partial [Candidatus Diapherotrites archaeon]|nr:shikimate dehydrogenase [Candidatus Diapherotrites archaeon]